MQDVDTEVAARGALGRVGAPSNLHQGVTHLAITEQYQALEHVEDLKPGLVNGEDDGAVGVCQ